MKRMRFAAIALLSAGAGAGLPCPAELSQSGSPKYQKWRAECFDPYPETDNGLMMAGTRPPGFEDSQPMSCEARRRIPYAAGY